MQFRPMMTAAEKSPAFLRVLLVLAATSSFLPSVFYRFLLFVYLVTRNQQDEPIKFFHSSSTYLY
jgi:hypothetical protein